MGRYDAAVNPPWLSELNPEQRQVVMHEHGPLLVLAGAGSGKTRALTCRIAYLVSVRQVDPRAILALTFTNRAAREMKHRIGDLCGDAAEGIKATTFHSFGAGFLRRHAARCGRSNRFVIYDDDDQKRLLKRLLKAAGVGDRAVSPADARRFIERARRGADPDGMNLPPGLSAGALRALLSGYETALERADAFDFGDLVRGPADALEADPAFRDRVRADRPWVLVDEYQDTDSTQEHLLTGLVPTEGNLMVVGDDDQAIYGWRGAEVANILGFQERRPEAAVVRLEKNYRSTAAILAAADGVISRNRTRLGKRLVPTLAAGEPVEVAECQDGRDEARQVISTIARAVRGGGDAPSDFAVFYRTNAQSRLFEDAMRRRGLPYEVVGGMRFYDRAEVKDLLAFARLALNRNDGVACMRILNVPARGIGKKAQAAVIAAGVAADGTPFDGVVAVAAGGAGRGSKAVGAFAALIDRLSEIVQLLPPSQALASILDETGYADMLRDRQAADPAARDRLDNLQELMTAAADHEHASPGEATLHSFLETTALHADVDSWDPADGRVTLMTLHTAKGLEFPFVFLTGMEEQLFPLARAGAQVDVEEERRLAYVGITRARRRLVLSWARRRMIHGETRVCSPSRFLREIPSSALKTKMSPVEAAAAGRLARRAHRPPGDPFSDDDFVDYDPDYDTPDSFIPALGERVFHEAFGEGEVVEHLGGHGAMTRVAVHFPARGVKRIVASYLSPV